eukprot:4181638-Prymnesium_polylepis.1
MASHNHCSLLRSEHLEAFLRTDALKFLDPAKPFWLAPAQQQAAPAARVVQAAVVELVRGLGHADKVR